MIQNLWLIEECEVTFAEQAGLAGNYETQGINRPWVKTPGKCHSLCEADPECLAYDWFEKRRRVGQPGDADYKAGKCWYYTSTDITTEADDGATHYVRDGC